MERKKILIVDDEADVLAVLEIRLTVEGYDVIKALNGTDALTLAKNEGPDLILLDIMMPGMDGTEVAQKLKEDPFTKSMPILFLTCLFTKNEETALGHGAGSNIFIAKPYNPDELLTEINKILKSKNLV